MKHSILLLLLLISVPLFATDTVSVSQRIHTLPPKSIRDTALLMLREFVIVGGDRELGFADSAEVMQAEIDSTDPLCFYYFGEGPFLDPDEEATEEVFINMHKVIYPVKINGRLCASISFNHKLDRWKVTEFQDSSEIKTYYHTRLFAKLSQKPVGDTNAILAYVPALHEIVVIEGSPDSGYVTCTDVLDTVGANNYNPESLEFMNKPRIPMHEFIERFQKYRISEMDMHHEESTDPIETKRNK